MNRTPADRARRRVLHDAAAGRWPEAVRVGVPTLARVKPAGERPDPGATQ